MVGTFLFQDSTEVCCICSLTFSISKWLKLQALHCNFPVGHTKKKIWHLPCCNDRQQLTLQTGLWCWCPILKTPSTIQPKQSSLYLESTWINYKCSASNNQITPNIIHKHIPATDLSGHWTPVWVFQLLDWCWAIWLLPEYRSRCYDPQDITSMLPLRGK